MSLIFTQGGFTAGWGFYVQKGNWWACTVTWLASVIALNRADRCPPAK
jgi:hypothetical protein